jgi:hypothetical protein
MNHYKYKVYVEEDGTLTVWLKAKSIDAAESKMYALIQSTPCFLGSELVGAALKTPNHYAN